MNALGDRVYLAPDEAFHLRKVLRIVPGRRVIVSNGQGAVHACETALAKGDAIELFAVECIEKKTVPPQLHLVLSLLKGKDLEDPVEGLCQLNIRAIHLVTTDHTQEFKGQNFDKLVERLRAKSLVGLKQAKKAWLTELYAPIGLREWRQRFPKIEMVLLHPGKDSMPLPHGEDLGLVVGPEGGFSADELTWFESQTKFSIGLGSTRIRSVQAPLLGCGKLMGLGWI